MAKRDAAFESYKALFKGGLIDDHLLPLGHVYEKIDEIYPAVEKRPSLVEARAQFNPWVHIATEWQRPSKIHVYTIKVTEGIRLYAEMLMLLPCDLPGVGGFDLSWSPGLIFNAAIEQSSIDFESNMIPLAAKCTGLLLNSVFPEKLATHDDFATLFVPSKVANLEKWLQRSYGTIPADEIAGNEMGLIRDVSNSGYPHVFQGVLYASTEDVGSSDLLDINADHGWGYNHSKDGSVDTKRKRPQGNTRIDSLWLKSMPVKDIALGTQTRPSMYEDKFSTITLLKVVKLPRKTDFLHPSSAQNAKIACASRPRILLAHHCAMDNLPFKYSQFAMFIPSILHRVQIALVVQ